MPTSSPRRARPRRVPPAQAFPQPEIGATEVAGAAARAAALGAAAGGAAGLIATAPAVPALNAAQGALTVDAVLQALAAFFVLHRARQEHWIVTNMRRPVGPVPSQYDILQVIAEESGRQAEFERRALARVRRDSARILQLPDLALLPARARASGGGLASVMPTRASPSQFSPRKVAIARMLRREETYARYRAEAMAVRALSAIDRTVLRVESPEGAAWVLDPDARHHTPDCVFMARYGFWPWAALDLLRPPAHTGCRCALKGKDEAVRLGIIKPGHVVMSDARALVLVRQAMAMLHEAVEEVLAA